MQGSPYTILVEAFADDGHIGLVHEELPESASRLVFLLSCPLKVAVERKAGELSKQVVEFQFERFEERAYDDRRRIDTSSRSPSEVAREIADLILSSEDTEEENS